MSHHVYTTRGLVLSLKPIRESDKVALIMTRDVGLVYGIARGIRKPHSKLSTSLLPLALARVSLVRGKNLWRVTTVTLLRDSASELRSNRDALVAESRISNLLTKLVRGEDANPELYDDLEKSLLMLLDGKVPLGQIDAWELYTVSRILLHLGYIKEEGTPNSLEEALRDKRPLLVLVNQGLRASELS